MALTGELLVDEVRAYIGRDGSTDMGAITDARVTLWLNEAQRDVAEHCVGISGLDYKCFTQIDISTDKITYNLADYTYGSDWTDLQKGSVHVYNVWHLNGADSKRLDYLPQDEFDKLLIDPTSSDNSGNRPTRWTWRRGKIEIAPRPSSDYDGDKMRVDGMLYPREFTTNDGSYCDLPNADEGLVMYAVAKAWGVIGGQEGISNEVTWKKKYSDQYSATGEFGWLEQYVDVYSRQEPLNANIFGFGDE
jgi:hypothetical protein